MGILISLKRGNRIYMSGRYSWEETGSIMVGMGEGQGGGREYREKQLELEGEGILRIRQKPSLMKTPRNLQGCSQLRILAMGDMKPKSAIFCNQIRLAVKGLRHQPSHKTFSLQFALPTKCDGVKVVQKLWEQPTNDWSSLRPQHKNKHTLTLPRGPVKEVLCTMYGSIHLSIKSLSACKLRQKIEGGTSRRKIGFWERVKPGQDSTQGPKGGQTYRT